MIELTAAIGVLALVILGAFYVTRCRRPRPAENAGETLAQMAEWMPTVPTESPAGGQLVGLEGGGIPIKDGDNPIIIGNDKAED